MLSDVGQLVQEKLIEKCTSLFLPCEETDAAANVLEAVDKKSRILQHLQWCETEIQSSFSFPVDMEWVNVSRPVSDDDIRGNLVLLDFFTYCCANCLHLLPVLRELEEEFPPRSGLKILGIHSAKFENEKNSENLESAVAKYRIDHPVCNDGQWRLWSEMGIFCWPTILFLSPELKPILVLVGESVKESLLEFIPIALGFYASSGRLQSPDSQLSSRVGMKVVRKDLHSLAFPGKVCAHGKKVFISDSGNNRVLICNRDGVIETVFAEEAAFSNPQGIAYSERLNHVFVADLGNNLVKRIDLNEGTVEALAGSGSGNDLGLGPSPTFNSPWDVCVGPLPNMSILLRLAKEEGSEYLATFCESNAYVEEVLYVAMAGAHQIWIVVFDGVFSGLSFRFAGSGEEEIRNNSYPHKAGFAQPSGISYSSETNSVYVADSESSAVREVSLSTGAVKTIAGGSRDPKNLFEFGDVDADQGKDVRLQHPLGVGWSRSQSVLFVADSYNQKIKVVDVPGGKTITVFDSGKNSEFGGLCYDSSSDLLFVADTNQHRILCGRYERGRVDLKPFYVRKKISDADRVWLDVKKLRPKGTLGLNFDVLLSKGIKLNEGAPQTLSYRVVDASNEVLAQHVEVFSPERRYVVVGDALPNGESKLLADVRLLLCADDSSVCFPAKVKFGLPIFVSLSPDEGEDECTVTFSASVTKPF